MLFKQASSFNSICQIDYQLFLSIIQFLIMIMELFILKDMKIFVVVNYHYFGSVVVVDVQVVLKCRTNFFCKIFLINNFWESKCFITFK